MSVTSHFLSEYLKHEKKKKLRSACRTRTTRIETEQDETQLLEVGVVVQRQQTQELRESLDLLRDALPGPKLSEHAHCDSEHRGPAMEKRRTDRRS